MDRIGKALLEYEKTHPPEDDEHGVPLRSIRRNHSLKTPQFDNTQPALDFRNPDVRGY